MFVLQKFLSVFNFLSLWIKSAKRKSGNVSSLGLFLLLISFFLFLFFYIVLHILHYSLSNGQQRLNESIHEEEISGMVGASFYMQPSHVTIASLTLGSIMFIDKERARWSLDSTNVTIVQSDFYLPSCKFHRAKIQHNG